MNSFKLFFSFYRQSFQVFWDDLAKYLGAYFSFVAIDLLASIPWEGIGFPQNSPAEIGLNIFIAILSLIVIVNVVLIEKSKYLQRQKEALIYAAPTYLIYTLYTSIIMLLGFLCLIIPGIILAVCFGMVPLASVLIDNDSVNYFKVSYRMARKNALLIIAFGVATLLVEVPGFLFDFIPSWQVRLGLNVVYSILDGAILVALTITSVRVFYHLKQLINDPS